MTAMPSERNCPECGAVPSPGITDGLCAQCLFSLGLEVPESPEPVAATRDIAPLLAKTMPGNGVKLYSFGDYELLEEIARGGMGVVFRARQISLNRTVALKLITAGHLATEADVKRFQLEAEAAARLDHPNIVPIYEVGEHGGHRYFSMRLVEGGTLAEAMQREGSGKTEARGKETAGPKAAPSRGGGQAPFSIVHLAKIARAVHYAHQRGVLHRDLKPGNILLDDCGEPHITDFGLAKLIEQDSSLTHSGMIMGTPSYMSPEQAEGASAELTTASDLWSLGTILYELLTGQPAFRGATPVETLRCVMEQEPVRPHTLNSTVDRDIETITLQCLEKDPARRYASAAALADDLEHWLRHEPILARRASALERVSKWARRQPMLAAAVILLHIVLAVGLAGILWQWRQAVVARQAERAERQRAVRAEGDALARLHEAKLNYVRANRLTGQLGQRFDSLAELTLAAARTNSLELRNEAIACLALPDLRPLQQWAKTPRWDSFRFSASHQRYVTNDASGTLTIRAADTDKLLFAMPGQGAKDVASFTAFSPDDRFVAALDKLGQVHIWDGEKQAARVIALPGEATLLTFTPESRALVVKYMDGSVHFLNATNGTDEKSFPVAPHLQSVRFDPSGAKLLAVTDERIIIHHASDGRLLKTITRPPGGSGGFRYAAWHPDGRRIAAAWRSNIGFWDSETGRQLALFEGHDDRIVGLAFSGTGQYIAIAAADHITRLWHTETFREVLRLPESGRGLSISADDRRLSLSPWGNTKAKLYELADVTVEHRVALPPATGQRVHSTIRAIFSPDSELVMACDYAAIFLFHVANPAVIELPVKETWTACFAPDGKSLFTGGANGAQKWPLNWSPDRSEVHVGPPEVLAPTRGVKIEVVEVSPDGQWLIAMNRQKNGTVVNIQLVPPFEVVPMDKSLCPCFHLDFSTDGRWAASIARSLDALQIWNARTGRLMTNIPSLGAFQCAFSSDGKWLACGQNDSTTIWNTTTWSLHHRIPHPPHDGRKVVTFSPDGRVLAIFNSNAQKVQLRRLETGEELASFPVGFVSTALRFNARGDRLAVANERGYVQLWDLRRLREQLASLQLDWDMPPYPPAESSGTNRRVRLIVHPNAPSATKVEADSRAFGR
jgi:WD40 repeat protein